MRYDTNRLGGDVGESERVARYRATFGMLGVRELEEEDVGWGLLWVWGIVMGCVGSGVLFFSWKGIF